MALKNGGDIDETIRLQLEVREFASNSRLQEIEQLLGLSTGFMKGLLDAKSDWEFVIKLAVVVEAALSQTIASLFDSTQMQDHLARLSIDGRSGKIQFAKDLGLIGPKAQARLRALASIRNAFAHDIAVIHSSLDQYLVNLGAAEGGRLINTLLSIDGVDQAQKSQEHDGDGARYVLWASGCLSLLELAHSYQNSVGAQSWREARTLLGEAFLARLNGAENEVEIKVSKARSILESIVKKKDTELGGGHT